MNLRKLVLTDAEAWLKHEILHLHDVNLRDLGGKTLHLVQHLQSNPHKLTLGRTETSPFQIIDDADKAFTFEDDFTMPSVQHFITLGYAFHLLRPSIHSRAFPNVRRAD